MVNNKKKSRSEDISVIDVLLASWKNKKLYLLMSLFFIFLGFIYSLTLNKNVELTSTIVFKDPPSQFFSNYKPFFDDNVINFDEISFIGIFNEKILSSNNLERFIEQNNEIDEFKAFLLEMEISPRVFFNNKIFRESTMVDKKTIVTNRFTVVYPEVLDGNKFLNDYIIFSKDLALNSFNEQKQIQIKNIILLYEQNLEIASTIGLSNPLIQNSVERNTTQLVGEPAGIFYQGTMVLKKRIANLKKLLKEFENNKNDYYPILDQAMIVDSNIVNAVIFPFLGLIIGIVLSFIVTLFRVL